MLVVPPQLQLPPALETFVAVEVKVTVKVTESLNSANWPCSALCQDYSLCDGTVNRFTGAKRKKRKAAYWSL